MTHVCQCGKEFRKTAGQRVMKCVACRNAEYTQRERLRRGCDEEKFEERGWVRMFHIAMSYNQGGEPARSVDAEVVC